MGRVLDPNLDLWDTAKPFWKNGCAIRFRAERFVARIEARMAIYRAAFAGYAAIAFVCFAGAGSDWLTKMSSAGRSWTRVLTDRLVNCVLALVQYGLYWWGGWLCSVFFALMFNVNPK